MKRRSVCALGLAALLAVSVTTTASAEEGAGRSAARPTGPLVHTYSIVARDPATGELGVAVQSHWFQVGVAVPWAEAGVGAVATQSFVEVSYGPKGLELMRQGKSAKEALDALLAADPERDVRQVAMVDAQGRAAAWTGPKCIAAAGHHVGDGYTVEANLMEKATVWPAMARAFEAAKGPLAERLLAALDAAQAEGGDIRGRQSAALLVVKGTSSGQPWKDREVDLRVDDSADPLGELHRLYRRHLAYQAMNAGDDSVAAGDVQAALAHYTAAAGLAPDIVELPFWQAVTLVSAGRTDEALPIFRRVFAAEPRWAELLPRLPAAGLLPDEPATIQRILAVAPAGTATPSGHEDRRDHPGEAPAPTAGAKAAAATEVTAVGVLTDEGAECRAMRGDDGRLVALTGDLGGFKTGDRVQVTGRVAAVSTCMQGTTIGVTSIAKAP
jgi:uncharacterized Ntn-hydrolase superfamily protein